MRPATKTPGCVFVETCRRKEGFIPATQRETRWSRLKDGRIFTSVPTAAESSTFTRSKSLVKILIHECWPEPRSTGGIYFRFPLVHFRQTSLEIFDWRIRETKMPAAMLFEPCGARVMTALVVGLRHV
jgi:hypothetical protein